LVRRAGSYGLGRIAADVEDCSVRLVGRRLRIVIAGRKRFGDDSIIGVVPAVRVV
jgi:hypothetical protein